MVQQCLEPDRNSMKKKKTYMDWSPSGACEWESETK